MNSMGFDLIAGPSTWRLIEDMAALRSRTPPLPQRVQAA
jgi:hypothetical protein